MSIPKTVTTSYPMLTEARIKAIAEEVDRVAHPLSMYLVAWLMSNPITATDVRARGAA